MKHYLNLIFVWISFSHQSQNIQCSFPLLSNQLVKFGVFDGLQSKNIDSVYVGVNGRFSFNFSINKSGIGYLITQENRPYFLILDKDEQITLKGEYLSVLETIKVLSGKQNQAFTQYAVEHPKREQTLSAWQYLNKIYSSDSLFINDKKTKKFISSQLAKILKQDQDFLKKLDPKSYIAWYLPARKLVSDVSIIAQYRPEEIPATITAFREIDYSDERLYTSGLLKDAIESHFWLLENSGKSLDSVFIEMKISIDAMMKNLVKDDKKLNEVTDYLFDLLEKHSLFQASEYLALKILNDVSCTINSNLAKQLEIYRVMKKGNIAPDMDFNLYRFSDGKYANEKPKKLSEIKSKYILTVFGASWCEKCKAEIPKIAALYDKWKKQGIEVLFVSLDEKESDFISFASGFPFLSICDYNKWESPIVQSYHVFGTPTMFLLDNQRKILLRPNSVNQIDAWVDWFLVKENH